MSSTNSRIQAYLQRIGFTGHLDGSPKTLAELQECHLHAVPYENLDILSGIPLSLDPEAVYDKVVERGRGGYCFELNALFGWLLRELGYPVTDLVARFWRDHALDAPPKRRHHVLQVEAEGVTYLCDVGVGGIVPRKPVAWVEGLEQVQGDECYRLKRDAAYGWMLSEKKDEAWKDIYSFTEEPQFLDDFQFATFWCEQAPNSPFRQTPIVAVRTREGRNTVAGGEFRIFTGEGVTTFRPESEEAYLWALNKHFGIVLPQGHLSGFPF
ncbi:arylamine N-acetyltransferase family protein [Paenibacillus ferrarius]|uniref:arylamine N-acetyltransferase family protein n=1 Tax=Paenibacillus ferrarius TaxID=1469647 RepID=UPI003D2D4E6A